MIKKFRNLVFAVIILAIAYLGQQPSSQKWGSAVYQKAGSWVTALYAKGEEFAKKNIFPRFSQEAQKRKEIVKEEIGKETKEMAGDFWQRTKNYFLEGIKKIFPR